METLDYNLIADLIIVDNNNLRSIAMKCVAIFEKFAILGKFSDENPTKEAWGFAKALKMKHPNFDQKQIKQFFINSYTNNVMETNTNESKTQKIRNMLALGIKPSEISKELNLSYQRVVNVKNEAKLKEKKQAKREAKKHEASIAEI